MTTYDGVPRQGGRTQDIRAEGPAVVRKGPQGGPAVVVLDPSGEARHDELPATWRPVSEQVEVVWWRLPTAERDASATDVLDGLHRAYLVGSRGSALLTLSLAVSHRAQVRSVVLVDPPWPVSDLPYVRRIVSNPELPIQQVDTDLDLPIGHPDVVETVLRALAAADPACGGTAKNRLSGLLGGGRR